MCLTNIYYRKDIVIKVCIHCEGWIQNLQTSHKCVWRRYVKQCVHIKMGWVKFADITNMYGDEVTAKKSVYTLRYCHRKKVGYKVYK